MSRVREFEQHGVLDVQHIDPRLIQGSGQRSAASGSMHPWGEQGEANLHTRPKCLLRGANPLHQNHPFARSPLPIRESPDELGASATHRHEPGPPG